MDLADPETFTEMFGLSRRLTPSFLVQELMEADLHQIIRSQQALTEAHHQYFIFQICRGLKTDLHVLFPRFEVHSFCERVTSRLEARKLVG